MDGGTASKVLVSSRVRGLLGGSEIVDVGLPNEAEAIEMLLSAAGQPAGAAAPPEARAVVQVPARAHSHPPTAAPRSC